VVVPYRNKQLKTYFYGRVVVTRKGLEAYFTVLIEFIWGKERMEVYLNSIEMGNGYMALRQRQNIGIEKMPKI
jgi:membrane peptidoglycan carboxypeptidase